MWLTVSLRFEAGQQPALLLPIGQGMTTIIDLADATRVLPHRWYAARARHTVYVKCGKGASGLWLHRFILDAPDDRTVDHINGFGLDNRRINLRLATNSQQQANRGLQRNNTTGYRGVTKRGQRFQAEGRYKGCLYNLGTYTTAEEAAHAYDTWARQAHGLFARVNFEDEQLE